MECHFMSSGTNFPVANASSVSMPGKLGSQQFYHKLTNGYHGAMQMCPVTEVSNSALGHNWSQSFGCSSVGRAPTADMSSTRKRSFDAHQFLNGPDEFKRQRISVGFEAARFDGPSSQHSDDGESGMDGIVVNGNGNGNAGGGGGVHHGHSVGAAVTSCGHHDLYLYDAMIAEMHGC